MRTISLDGLRDLLSNVRGTTAVSFVALTKVDARKTGNPHKLGIYKLARVNAMLGTNHEAAVVRQQAREGVTDPTYVAQERSWGERVSGALVRKGEDYYLPVQLNPTVCARPVYLVPKIDANGKPRLVPIPEAEVAPWLPPDRREAQAAHQGVARPVERRDYKLSSLAYAALNGERLRVRS